MNRILICDMDGTVIDSMGFLKELAIALVAADGHSEALMREVYESTVGIPIVEQFYAFNMRHSMLVPLDVRKLAALYETIHKLAARNFPSTAFGKSLAAWRWDQFPNWRIALVTSTHRSIVETMPQLFHAPWIYVGGRTVKGTDKEGQIWSCLNQLKVTSLEGVVYVGDSPSDKALAEKLRIPFFEPHPDLLYGIVGTHGGIVPHVTRTSSAG